MLQREARLSIPCGGVQAPLRAIGDAGGLLHELLLLTLSVSHTHMEDTGQAWGIYSRLH